MGGEIYVENTNRESEREQKWEEIQMIIKDVQTRKGGVVLFWLVGSGQVFI